MADQQYFWGRRMSAIIYNRIWKTVPVATWVVESFELYISAQLMQKKLNEHTKLIDLNSSFPIFNL